MIIFYKFLIVLKKKSANSFYENFENQIIMKSFNTQLYVAILLLFIIYQYFLLLYSELLIFISTKGMTK